MTLPEYVKLCCPSLDLPTPVSSDVRTQSVHRNLRFVAASRQASRCRTLSIVPRPLWIEGRSFSSSGASCRRFGAGIAADRVMGHTSSIDRRKHTPATASMAFAAL